MISETLDEATFESLLLNFPKHMFVIKTLIGRRRPLAANINWNDIWAASMAARLSIPADLTEKDFEYTRQSKRIHKAPRWQDMYDPIDDLLPDSPPPKV